MSPTGRPLPRTTFLVLASAILLTACSTAGASMVPSSDAADPPTSPAPATSAAGEPDAWLVVGIREPGLRSSREHPL
jgi:hypothetical protein